MAGVLDSPGHTVLKAKTAVCCVCGEERMIFHSERAYAAARYHWRCSDACDDRWERMKKPTFMCRVAECKCDEVGGARNVQGVIRLLDELVPPHTPPPIMPRPSVKNVLEAEAKRKADEGPVPPPPPPSRRFCSNVARMSSQPPPQNLSTVDLVHREGLLRRYRVDERRDWPARLPDDRIGNVEAALQHLMEELRMLRDSLPGKIEELAYPIAVDAAREESVDVRELEERVKACEDVIEGLH